jgi:hypothetical protein
MDSSTLLLLTPIVVIDLLLIVYALYDLSRPDRRVKGGSKLIWALVILLVSTIGPLVYLFAGREDA